MNIVPKKAWNHEPCYWRYGPRQHWKRGNAIRVLNDVTGSVLVDRDDGGVARVPNDPIYIKER